MYKFVVLVLLALTLILCSDLYIELHEVATTGLFGFLFL